MSVRFEDLPLPTLRLEPHIPTFCPVLHRQRVRHATNVFPRLGAQTSIWTANSEDFQAGILPRRLRWIVKRRKINDKTNVAMGTIIQAHCIWMYTSKELDVPDAVAGRSEVVRSLGKPLASTGGTMECQEVRTHSSC